MSYPPQDGSPIEYPPQSDPELAAKLETKLQALAEQIQAANPGAQEQRALNYPVSRPDGSMEPRYPVDHRGHPARSAIAYIDYIEGSIAELHTRLRTLEEAHANFVAGMYTRMSAVEHSIEGMIGDLKGLQVELAPFIHPAAPAQEP